MSENNSEEPIQQAEQSVFKVVFTKAFVAVSLINFFLMVGYYAIFVVFTQYAQATFHTSTATAGLLTGIVVIGCLVGRFFSGSIVHKFGYLKILTAGLTLYFIANLLYFVGTNSYADFFIRVLHGIALGITSTVTGTLVAVITPKKFQGRGIAYFSMSTALSLCFGPFLGISLLGVLGYTGIFLLSCVLCALAFVCLLFIKVKNEKKSGGAHKIALSDFIDVKLIPFACVVAVFCIAWGNIQAFIGPYGEIENVQAAVSMFFLFYAGAVLASRPFTGKIFDVKGPDLIFYTAIFSLGLGCILLWACPYSWTVLLSGLLCGYGFGNITSTGQALAISLVPRERFAQATSTYFIFFDIGVGMAPYVSGYLVPSFGYTGVFGFTALAVFAGLPLYWLVTRNAVKPDLGRVMKFKDRSKD